MPAIMMILTNIMLQVGMITLVQSTKAKERTVDEDSRIALLQVDYYPFSF